jgi:hypothetical protein
MLETLWQSWMTSTKVKQAKSMGFLKESVAMTARARRCEAQWQDHYERCQLVLLDAIERCEQKRTALVFGAGSLKDIPLEVLSEKFEKVVLVDLVFLKSARQIVRQFSNVELVEHDVTESLSWFEEGMAFVQKPSKWLDDNHIDLVVSLNLITQIPLIPVKWLLEKYHFEESQLDIAGKQLIFAHLDYLRQFNSTVCLIADRQDVEFNSLGEEVDRFDPWWNIEPPKAIVEWEWEVVPYGDGKDGLWQKNRVGVSFL